MLDREDDEEGEKKKEPTMESIITYHGLIEKGIVETYSKQAFFSQFIVS